jgi:hypothetical protein
MSDWPPHQLQEPEQAGKVTLELKKINTHGHWFFMFEFCLLLFFK